MTTTPEGLPYVAPFGAQFDPRQAQEFIIMRLIRGIHTNTIVKVLAVRPTTGKVGFVDVQPLVQEQDTRGKVLAQAPIYNVPYFRYQGGVSAIIMDPAPGDIGLAQFAERDIRGVKATQAQAPAGSDRVYNSADALYIGGVLNPDPTQFVEFLAAAAGVKVVTPGTVDVHATGVITLKSDTYIKLDAATVQVTGTIVAPEVQLPNALLNNHKHGGVATGTGNSGGPHN